MKREDGGYGCDMASLGEVTTNVQLTTNVKLYAAHLFAGSSGEVADPTQWCLSTVVRRRPGGAMRSIMEGLGRIDGIPSFQ